MVKKLSISKSRKQIFDAFDELEGLKKGTSIKGLKKEAKRQGFKVK